MSYVVYILSHVNNYNQDVKNIGVFSCKNKIDEAISLLKSKPGFNKSIYGFKTTKFILNKTHFLKGYLIEKKNFKLPKSDIIKSNYSDISSLNINHVFFLTHFYDISEEYEEVRYIGVYSDIRIVNDIIDKLKFKNGFKNHKESFNIDKIIIDKIEWTDGFVSWEEAST